MMQMIRIKITGTPPRPSCPYCGKVDSDPSPHLSGKRCK